MRAVNGYKTSRLKIPLKIRSGIILIASAFLLPGMASSNVFSRNLVVNGSFGEGTNGWDSLLVNSPAQATRTVTNGICGISISAAGAESWHVQLKQKGIALDSSGVYCFSFEAYAAAAREIEASVGMENGPYTLYTPANQVRFLLTTEKQKFTIYFYMGSAGDPNARVQFNCGLAAVDVFITSVSVEKVTTPMMLLLSPRGGEAWNSATSQEIVWIGAGMQNVALSYTIDAGLSWIDISTNAENSGRFLWTVPATPSPWCFVRVLDAGGSGLGDTSAQPFEIGAYSNLIRNGDFNGPDMPHWNPLGVYGSASGNAAVRNGVCEITVTTPGTENWNIQFNQSGIRLSEGETYIFSFSAWADSSRQLYANIGQSGGAYESYLGDTAKGQVALSTMSRTYRIEFTMSKPGDSNARVDFNTGTSAGSVYLDNVSLYQKKIAGVRHLSADRRIGERLKMLFELKKGSRGTVYSIPLRGLPVRARILDLKGKQLKTMSVDKGTAFWDCRSEAGAPVAPGAYCIQIITVSGTSVAPVFVPVR
jgi:hypothetical protein